MARGGHAMNLVGEQLIVFGGCYLDLKCFDDLYFFNLRTREWSLPKTIGEAPSARSGHSATLFGTFLYVFGGASAKGLHNDVFVLDLESRSWSELVCEGPKPSPRSNHGAVLAPDGAQILLFGGYTESGYSDELFALNIVERRWEKPRA
jgi:N-acetylneuraminic acid mutarotase